MPWVEVPEPDVENSVDNEDTHEEQIKRRFMGNILKCNKIVEFKPNQFESLKASDLKPLPRSGHRIVCEEGNMYSYGGYLERQRFITLGVFEVMEEVVTEQHLFDELWELNALTNEWRLLVTFGEPPTALASHSMVLLGHHLVVYGGTGVPFGQSSSNEMHVCDLRTLKWNPIKTTGIGPSQQYGQAVVMDKNEAFYVVGGTTGYEYSIDVHKLDMKTFEWEALFIAKGNESEPDARYRHEIALEADIIYVFGGGTAAVSFDLVQLPAFSLKTKEWSLVPTFSHNGEYPKPRKCHGYVRRGNDIFISGGYDNRHIFDDIWKLYLPTMEWTKLGAVIPVPTYFHASAITPAGCLFIFGGITNIKRSSRTDQLYKVWLTIPTLKEIAWSSVHHYARGTEPSCIEKVVDTIPEEFKDRLPRKLPKFCPIFTPVSPIRPQNTVPVGVEAMEDIQ